jgi:hypothetical protein
MRGANICAAALVAATTVHLAACRGQPEPRPAVEPIAADKADSGTAASAPAGADQVYVCPMDKDIRAYAPGTCSRCGMALVTSVPEPVEYLLDISAEPPPAPGRPTELLFDVRDPWKANPVTKFGLIHEKRFHSFIVGRDLEFFLHGHPEWQNGAFRETVVLPRPGMYRILGDFYPEAATPQLSAQTIFVAGEEARTRRLATDYSTKHTDNLQIALAAPGGGAVAGEMTALRFTLGPAEEIEKLLGAWGHMLAASEDLIDLIHEHPFLADGGPEVQFRLIFPRPGYYRIWVQFQREGVVNTAHFDLPVRAATPSAP